MFLQSRYNGIVKAKNCSFISSILNNTLYSKNVTIFNNKCFYSSKRNKNKKKIELKPLTFPVPSFTSLNNLASLMKVNYDSLERKMKNLGFENVTSKYILTREYIELVLQEYNYSLKEITTAKNSSNLYEELKEPINPKYLTTRPPMIAIMGHVDHGKTTLLDHLRRSNVVDGEHGGITQHIGAFKVITPVTKSQLTFLDTPGHSAFLKMRERGAKCTDLVILVVDCDDLVMEQTKEAIKHIKNNLELQNPEDPDSVSRLVVVMSKIDKIPVAADRKKRLDTLKQQLVNEGIPVEGLGGDVPVICISARTGENMDVLEENLVTLGEVLDLKAESNSKQMCEGYVVETNKDPKIGVIATVLIKRGILKTGAFLLCGNTYCKVKRMDDENSKVIKEAKPSDVVQLIGWKDVPEVGDEIIQVKSEKIAKKYIAERQQLIQEEQDEGRVSQMNEEAFLSKGQQKLRKQEKLESRKNRGFKTEDNITENGNEIEGYDGDVCKEINYIIKGDVAGSVEAIRESLMPLKNKEVKCNVIGEGVGLPTENDFKLAKSTDAKIICFNLGKSNEVVELKNTYPQVELKEFNVIYHLIEDVVETLTENLKPIYKDKELFKASILKVLSYKIKNRTVKIAGCKVTDGLFRRKQDVIVKRGKNSDEMVEVYRGKLATLKRNLDDVSEVNKGVECACTFVKFDNFEEGDVIAGIEEIPVERVFIPEN